MATAENLRKVFEFALKFLLVLLLSFFIGIAFLGFGLAMFSLGMSSLLDIYQYFPANPSEKYKTFAAIAGTIVALFGVIAGLATFLVSAHLARRAQRKQHTITVLLETRLSEYFQQTIKLRRKHFPEFSDVDFANWKSAYLKQESNTHDAEDPADLRASAAALLQLLNYYEFLAVGIMEGDLDELMLRKTIRGIMCNLVDDARDVIGELRRQNPKNYEHLVWLYDNWRKPNAIDINGNPNERPIPN